MAFDYKQASDTRKYRLFNFYLWNWSFILMLLLAPGWQVLDWWTVNCWHMWDTYHVTDPRLVSIEMNKFHENVINTQT